MTDSKALIEEARDWAERALPPSPWADNHIALRLASALEAEIAEADPYCREEACQYRHWTSGTMPTHRRGAGCPEPQPGGSCATRTPERTPDD